MAMVWLRREDCESGNLPELCLCCGWPTTERATVNGRSLVWGNPLRPLGSGESWPVSIPVCGRHRRHWRRYGCFLAAAWAQIALTVGAFASFVSILFIQGEIVFVFDCV